MDIFPYDLAILICEYATEVPTKLLDKYIGRLLWIGMAKDPANREPDWKKHRQLAEQMYKRLIIWKLNFYNNRVIFPYDLAILICEYATEVPTKLLDECVGRLLWIGMDEVPADREPDWKKHRQLAEQMYDSLII